MSRTIGSENLFAPERLLFHISLAKFCATLLPVFILGHILGIFIAADMSGWEVNPLFIVLNGLGILLAMLECRSRL